MKVKCHPELGELFFELQDMRRAPWKEPLLYNYSWKLIYGLRAILKDVVLNK